MNHHTAHLYATSLRDHLAQHADPSQIAPMRAYMKNQFAFLGLKSPERVRATRAFIAEHGLPSSDEIQHVCWHLWELPERECQYAALDLLDRTSKCLPPEAIDWTERLIVTKSWWDTVDTLAIHVVGHLFERYPDLRPDWIGRWRVSDNLWLRRTALLFQLRYKRATDTALLFDLIEANRASREFFIQKAIGWALREYSKTDPDAVAAFVAEISLAPLSRREALKWIHAHPRTTRP
jgi:3-methyladenine DNA glycosylase AlkD